MMVSISTHIRQHQHIYFSPPCTVDSFGSTCTSGSTLNPHVLSEGKKKTPYRSMTFTRKASATAIDSTRARRDDDAPSLSTACPGCRGVWSIGDSGDSNNDATLKKHILLMTRLLLTTRSTQIRETSFQMKAVKNILCTTEIFRPVATHCCITLLYNHIYVTVRYSTPVK